MVWLTDKRRLALFPARANVHTITNPQHAGSRIWTYAEPEFRLWWINLYSKDSHYIMALRYTFFDFLSNWDIIYSLDGNIEKDRKWIENCNDEKRQKHLKIKASKYHFVDGKAKAMEYYYFNNKGLQKQLCEY